MRFTCIVMSGICLFVIPAFPQGYPHVSIQRIQQVSSDSLAQGLTSSYYVGDTVWTTGVVTLAPRDPQTGRTMFLTGNAFRLYMQDPGTPEWGAIEVVSEDTLLTMATNKMHGVSLGDSIGVLGEIREYRSVTRISMLHVNTALIVYGRGTVLLPFELPLSTFIEGTRPKFIDAEKYESSKVTFRNLLAVDTSDPYLTAIDSTGNRINLENLSYELSEAWKRGDVPSPGNKIAAVTGFMTVWTRLTWQIAPSHLSDIVISGLDVIPPDSPTGLAATAGDRIVVLTWKANTESDLLRYRIYRDMTSPASMKIDSVALERTSFADANIENGRPYVYRMTAVDYALNESDYSNEATATAREIFTDIGAPLVGATGSSAGWGDYDNDGDLDLLLTGAMKIYRNDNGIFVDIPVGISGVYSGSVAWGDYDNDGDLDILLIGQQDGVPISKVYQNEDGRFADISAGLPAASFGSAAWGDYDSDGDLDILLTGVTVGMSRVYRNDRGRFVDISAGLPAVQFGDVAWGDYDNDGDLDILLAGSTGTYTGIAKVYRNDSGHFVDISAGLRGFSFASAAWGDYDNDGDLDILLTGDTGGTYTSKVYRNDNGIFVDIHAALTWVGSGSVAWGDYDNDGRLDILLTGSSGGLNVSKVFRNDNENFVDVLARLTPVSESSAAWGDYDNDGDLDIFLSGMVNYYSPSISKVYRNAHPTANRAPASPSGLKSLASGDSATLTWDRSTDTESPSTALTYNLRVGTTPAGAQIVTPMADPNTGYRKLPAPGNSNSRNTWTIRNLQEGTYFWSVQAIDNAFTGSTFAEEQSFTIDVAPAAPQALVATSGDEEATLTWSANVESDLLLYRIYRATLSPASVKIDSVPAATVYVDTNVLNGRTYFYRVTAVDEAGNESGFSNEVHATPRVIPGEYETDTNTRLLLHMDEPSGLIVSDASGNRNHGYASRTTIVEGRFGKGRSFARSGDFISIKDSPTLRPQHLTVEAWVYPSEYKESPAGIIASKQQTSWSFSYRLQLAGSTGRIYFATSIRPDEGVTSTTQLQDGNWYHVAGTFDGTALKLYINGALEGSRIQPGEISYGSAALYLGGDINNAPVWKGTIDEVRISDIARIPPFNDLPFILSIGDIPNDQGGRVLLRWSSSLLDTNVSILPFYSIWRALPAGSHPRTSYALDKVTPVDLNSSTIRTAKLNGKEYSWEWLANQPAHRFLSYSYAAATLYDSMSTTDGKHYFLVSAHTSDPNTFYDSNADSGYSVDNLAPLPPKNLVATYDGTTVTLHWNPNKESDLRQYMVYKSTFCNINPDTLLPFAATADTTLSDTGPFLGNASYYVVQAEDIHGNLSRKSGEVAVILTGIEAQGAEVPTVYQLRQNYPNPFNPSTTIRYELPTRSHVVLKVINVLGEEVATLVDEEKEAGIYHVRWMAKGMASGVYFLRLHAANFSGTKKLLLVK